MVVTKWILEVNYPEEYFASIDIKSIIGTRLEFFKVLL